jgi:hypothetical protein
MYDYETRFQESFDRAQREYENQTPESFLGQDDMTDEEWADMDQNEPDWDSMNEDW